MTVASRAFLPEFNPHRVRNAARSEDFPSLVRSDSIARFLQFLQRDEGTT
jgi:hypothetical protein